MSEIELNEVPEVIPEGEEIPQEPSPEINKPVEPKIEEQKVPYERFKEVNENLKAVQGEIQELRSKGENKVLSEEEQKELQAKEFIVKAAKEAYNDMIREQSEAETARVKAIEDEVKFYQSMDKDFTDKVAEEIASKFGSEKNPIEVETAFKIFKEQKEFKSQLPGAPKPKVPNPIRTGDVPAEEIPIEELRKKSLWDIASDVKKSLTNSK